MCWTVYDPAVGDDVWQVPPGTDFEALPPQWRCPKCDAPKERFLRPREEEPEVDLLPSLLEAAYRHIQATAMQDVPLLNPALAVEAVDFEAFDGGLLGALVTPWSLNVVFVPPPGPCAPAQGRTRALPAGTARFLPQHLDGVGEVELLSLFSPVPQFEDQAAAVATARESLRLLRTFPVKETPRASRRELLTFFRPGPAS